MQMERLFSDAGIRVELPNILEGGGYPALAERFCVALEAVDLIDRLCPNVAAVADALEHVALDPSGGERPIVLMDFATMLRVHGGSDARRGKALDWREFNPRGYSSATDAEGTSWDVGPGTYGWGITVAGWDRPDWYAASEEQAKAVAEELAARPKFSRDSTPVIELPFE